MKRLLDSKAVAECLSVSPKQAIRLMESMEHMDIGQGGKRSLRVTEDALQAWMDSKTVRVVKATFGAVGKMPRQRGGKLIAG